MTSNSSRRFLSVSFFESFSPSICTSFGRMTAAAQTGPASGPLPASSTPQTNSKPSANAACS